MVPLGVDPTPQLGESPTGGTPPAVSVLDPDRASRRRRRISATLVVLIAITIIVGVLILPRGGEVLRPSYRTAHGTVWLTVQNGQQVLAVTVVVKNTGKVRGTPTCVVHTTYQGFGLHPSTLTVKPPIKPGGVRIFISPLPIPPVLIAQVKRSDVTVTCRDRRAFAVP